MKKELSLALVLVVLVLLVHSCAQVGQIEGGLKDSIPPTWIASKPLNYSTNFDQKKVRLYFDEYIKLTDIDNQLVLSPPTSTKPEAKLWGKRITVQLPDTLENNTTYTIDFRNSIADFTEGNPLPGLRFVFSTGPELDSLALAGNLYNALTLQPEADVYVSVFEQLTDSAPYKKLPAYTAKTDTAGRFHIGNMRPGSYQLFALRDMNQNIRFDIPDEAIAFDTKAIEPKAELLIRRDTLLSASGKRDSVVSRTETMLYPADLRLFLFTEEHRVPYITGYKRTAPERIELAFNRLLNNDLNVAPIPSRPLSGKSWLLERNATNDTLALWLLDTNLVQTDTLMMSFRFASLDTIERPTQRTDTLKLMLKADTKIDSSRYVALQSNLGSKKLGFDDDIYFNLQQPVSQFDAQRIHLYQWQDTTVEDLRAQALVRFQRPRPDSLVFWFRRPLPEPPAFSVPGLPNNWYLLSLHDNNTKARLLIRNTELAQRDTLHLEAHFSNLFYDNVVLPQRSKHRVAYSLQRILGASRPAADHVQIYLDKYTPTLPPIELVGLGPAANHIRQQQRSWQNDTLRIDLWLHPSATRANHLLFELGLNDETLHGTDTTYTARVGLLWKKQALLSAQRIDSSRLELRFQTPVAGSVKLEPSNFRARRDWYQATWNADSTTLQARLTDPDNQRQDTLAFLLEYSVMDSLARSSLVRRPLSLHRGQKLRFDTLAQTPRPVALTDTAQNRARPKTATAKGSKTKRYTKLPFRIEKDPSNERLFWLRANLETDANYILRLDSMAFQTHWKRYNDTIQYAFQLRPADEYGSLSILLGQLPRHAYAQLLDDKGERVRRQIGSVQQANLQIDLLEPGDYLLQIFADENQNGRWDTGNFLQGRQPERVWRFATPIKIKAAFVTEETWDLSKFEQSRGPRPKTKTTPKKK